MMDSNTLLKGHCVPCEGGVDPLSPKEVAEYASILKTPWKIEENKQISRQFQFKNFVEAMAFVNKVADLAEAEGHHPDITISYSNVDISLTTHAIGGLSTNDFILARKIEELSYYSS